MRYIVRFRKKGIIFSIFVLLILQILISNNVVSVDEKPDLIIDIEDNIINDLDEIFEGEEVTIPVIVLNDGDKNISDTEIIDLGLKIDGIVVSSNSSSKGLDIGEDCYINLTWTPSYEHVGQNQLITIMVDYNEMIIEKIEYNNVWDKYVNISEGDTDLRIINFTLDKKNPSIDEEIKVYVDVKNYGKTTDEGFQVIFEHIQGGQSFTKNIGEGIERNETKQLFFNWTSNRFGIQTLKVIIRFNDETVDFLEKTVNIEVESLSWWDENYHFRHLIITDGFGNISYDINFTGFFDEIGINGILDEKTVKIVGYGNNGEIKTVIDEINLTKQNNYNNFTNARVYLKWNVTKNLQSRHFCIYFDIKDNNGDRTNTTIKNIPVSGDIVINKTGFIQAWDYEVNNPVNNSVLIINELLDVQVKTQAVSENVIAIFYHDDIFVKKVFLDKNNDNINWNKSIDFLNKTGNWKIVFSTYDKSGYKPKNITVYFSATLIDIISDEIVISTNWPTSPKVYQKDIVKISGVFITYNKAIDNVDCKIQIYNIDDEEYVYNDTKIIDFKKDINNTVIFYWTPEDVGEYNITITSDYKDEINESNEENNILEKKVTVNGLPNLAVTSIDLPEDEIIESQRAIINVTVENINNIKAEDYQIFLYVQSVEEDVFIYDNIVYSRNITLDGNEIKKYDLIWDDTESGEWKIMVLINVSDIKRDLDFDNNRKISDENLFVKSVEKNPPKIANIIFDPSPVEQGDSITITADVFDDNGIEYVKIIITDPDNISKTWDMTRKSGTKFIFVFDDTMKTGFYDITIKAKDLSIFENIVEENSRLKIQEDFTDPILYYTGADPNVQLTFEILDIICIASDNIEIEDVTLVITTPDDEEINVEMIFRNDGKYAYSRSYQNVGRYEYMVTIVDSADNIVTSEKKYFWITEDLADKDNDGISDEWERLYNLNPEDPSDADSDFDDDGFTNLEEYKYGFHPGRNLFSQNALKRIDENSLYLSGSVLIFVFLLIFILFLRRRKIL